MTTALSTDILSAVIHEFEINLDLLFVDQLGGIVKEEEGCGARGAHRLGIRNQGREQRAKQQV